MQLVWDYLIYGVSFVAFISGLVIGAFAAGWFILSESIGCDETPTLNLGYGSAGLLYFSFVSDKVLHAASHNLLPYPSGIYYDYFLPGMAVLALLYVGRYAYRMKKPASGEVCRDD